MSIPVAEVGYRFLEEHEKDGRYSNGRSEFWHDHRWQKSGSTPTRSCVYRVSTQIHNPEGFADHILETDRYRHLKNDELDGRFDGKAEMYMRSYKEWVISTNVTATNITYRILREQSPPPPQPSTVQHNPQNISEELIDLKNYRLITDEERKTAKWKDKAEYYDPDECKWVVSYCADMYSTTYRLHRKYDLPKFPPMPEEFKLRHFSAHEIAETCALYGEVDVPSLLVYWNCKQVPGAPYSFYYDPPAPVKVLTIQEQLPELFKYEELVEALDSHSQALKLRNFGDVIEVPGSPGTYTFAPKKEEKQNTTFDLFKSAMNPMFSYSDTKSFITHAEFWNYLETGKIQKIAGTEKYEFTNN